MKPYDRVVAALEAQGCRQGNQFRCPAHDDQKPSLSVGEGEDGRVLIKCHAGCSTDSIVANLGLRMADLFEPNGAGGPANGVEVTERYDYTDEASRLLFQVERLEPKDFRCRRPEGHGWCYSLGDVRRVPYRLPEMLCCEDEPVWVVEGEKDADRLANLGLVATCNPHGAGKWRPEFSDYFRGREVAIIPDNDRPGLAHARDVAAALRGIASGIWVVRLPDLPPGGDVSDWLDQGHTIHELVNLLAAEWSKCKGGEGDSLGADRLERADFAEIAKHGIPRKPKLIDGWLPEKAIVTMFGTGGVGKSTLLAQLAYSLVTGSDFCGLPVARPCRVVVLDEDQDFETSVRLYSRAWPDHVPPADRFALYCGQGVRLHDPKSMARLEHELGKFRPDLLIGDTWQALTSGINDDNNSEVGAALDRVIELRNKYGCAVLFTDHRRKSREPIPGAALSDELRGASVKRDKADLLWLAKRAEGENVLQLLQAKNRHGPLASLQVRYSEERIDGDEEPRIVLTGEGPVVEQARLADRIVRLVAAYVREHPEPFAPREIKALAEQELGQAIHSKPLYAAIHSAIADGLIERRSHGKYQGKVSGEKPGTTGGERGHNA